MDLQTLQHTNQPVHVQIPEINFCEQIRFGHFRTAFSCGTLPFGFLPSKTVSEECSECWLCKQIAERPKVRGEGQISALFSVKEEVPRPALEEKEPGNWDAERVAPRVRNG